MKKVLLLLLFSFSLHGANKAPEKVDLVIFSFDRPLQLYALLESCETHLKGLGSTHVVMRSSSFAFDGAYKLVRARFPHVVVHEQSWDNPPQSFKKKVLDAVFGNKAPSNYFMFAVDDMIVTDSVDLTKCVKAMKSKKPWFFSLRLGRNIHFDTIQDIPTPPPQGTKHGKDMMLWRFKDGKGGWGYPNSTDMTIYRKADVRYFLQNSSYTNPNTMEGVWSLKKPKRGRGLAFTHSKVINIPMNCVNTSWTLPNMNITTSDLLRRFEEGYKIDIHEFHKINNYATHMNYSPHFVKRNP